MTHDVAPPAPRGPREARFLAPWVLGLAILGAGCLQYAPLPPAERPASWARPVVLPGVANAFSVDGRLFRGAQPTREGFEALAALGVRVVVNLRTGASDAGLLDGLPLVEIRVPVSPWTANEEDLARVLEALDSSPGPVFLHCYHGSDRTGLACAAYRVAVQGWDPAEAAREMTRGGFGFHRFWSNLLDRAKALDAERLRGMRAAGRRPPGP